MLDAIGLDEAFDEALKMMKGCEKYEFGKYPYKTYTKEETKVFDKKLEVKYEVHPLEQLKDNDPSKANFLSWVTKEKSYRPISQKIN